MALLVIKDSQGKEHLIHSSQIGPQVTPARSQGRWRDVWERWDSLAFDSNAKPLHFASIDRRP